ncbi:MAG: ABC-2 type transport system ATP-binding protein [Cellvibrionaceae bacterium]|jgi:ABC-2 type transport system ATP-binding protein
MTKPIAADQDAMSIHDNNAIRVQNLSRHFGSLKAVNAINLTVPKACIYGFLGPNGSGKSTAMRMITGLLSPTSGSISVLGLDIPKQAEALRPKVGYMTQHFSLYGDLTVIENLQFVAAIYAIPRPAQRIEEVIQHYRLYELRQRRTGTLSGGQRQLVALAAAILHQPELLVLDEPTSAVDPESRRSFWENLFDLVEAGATVLVSTHLMDEAERCHRIAILDEGKKVADDEPATLLANLVGRVITISAEHARSLRAPLMAMSIVKGVSQVGRELRVLLHDNAKGEAGLALIQSEIGETHLPAIATFNEPNLEDVFVDVTQSRHD